MLNVTYPKIYLNVGIKTLDTESDNDESNLVTSSFESKDDDIQEPPGKIL